MFVVLGEVEFPNTLYKTISKFPIVVCFLAKFQVAGIMCDAAAPFKVLNRYFYLLRVNTNLELSLRLVEFTSKLARAQEVIIFYEEVLLSFS